MNHNESNIVSLKLSEYVAKSDAEKVDRKGWVNYGDQNDFPQYLRDLAHESPVHGSLVVAIGDMIAGKGIKSEQYQAELDALDVNALTYACAHDLKLFGGFYIEVIWSNDRTVISKLNAIPFEECRIAVNQDDDSEIGIFHSYDWSNTRKKKNSPEFIPKYNYLTREQEPRQIYWCFTYTGSDVYPRPDYWSAINYIELDKQISIFHINQISNGLFPSTIINFYNGQATPEQKQQMMMDWENKMSGARNAGKVVMFFNERDQPKTEITPFPVNDADKQYQLMDTTATQKIITAHRVTTPLLFGIRETSGFGSNKDEMATGLEIFNKQVIDTISGKDKHQHRRTIKQSASRCELYHRPEHTTCSGAGRSSCGRNRWNYRCSCNSFERCADSIACRYRNAIGCRCCTCDQCKGNRTGSVSDIASCNY
jgi:hypothetical protein